MKTAGSDAATARARGAVQAYVDPESLFDVLPPDALVPHLAALVAIARDPNAGDAAAYAIKLIRTIGPPRCIAPLVELIGYPHPNPNFKLVSGGQRAQVRRDRRRSRTWSTRLPDVPYARDQLFGAVASITADDAAAPRSRRSLRELLADNGSDPPVGRDRGPRGHEVDG